MAATGSGGAAVRAVGRCAERMAKCRELNAFVTETVDRAVAAAEAADAATLPGSGHHGVSGVPIAIKDSYCMTGVRTTCCSPGLKDFVPPFTATVVSRLEDAGACVIGKTNLDEFGMGSFNIHSAAGPCVNPHDQSRVSGGSSGGSAAAVAAGFCSASVGSDTGGSVRLPAAYCGVVGWKPSYGRSSRFGLAAFGSSFDTPGVFATTVRGAAIMANAMSGMDASDATCTLPATTFVPQPGANIAGLTVGIPAEYRTDAIDPAVLQCWAAAERWLEDCGAKVVKVSLPLTRHALPAYYLLTLAEASSNMARYDGVRYGTRAKVASETASVRELITESRGAGFGEEVKRRILAGSFVLSRALYDSHYVQAQRVRRLVCDDFAKVFDSGVDVLLTPTVAGPAPTLSAASSMDQIAAFANDVFTVPASLAGAPAINVPVGHDNSGLPLGLQVIGNRGSETSVLKAAQALEDAAGLVDSSSIWGLQGLP